MLVGNHHSNKAAWANPVVPRTAHDRLINSRLTNQTCHFSSAPSAVNEEIKKLIRPKSTPVKLTRVSEEFESAPTGQRPSTVTNGANPECRRLEQLEWEPTRKQNFNVHLPTRKHKTPSGRRNLDSPQVTYHMSSGIEIAKTKDKIMVNIPMDYDLQPKSVKDEKVVRKPLLDPAIESYITLLQDQIDDLTVYLEEERLNHRETIRSSDEVFRQRLEGVLKAHDDEVTDLRATNEQNVHELTEKFSADIYRQKVELNDQIEKLTNDVEYLQSAFESYKTNLQAENAEHWKIREVDLASQHAADLDAKLQDLRTKLTNERNAQKAALQRQHKKQLSHLDKGHKRNTEELKRQFLSSTAELERLRIMSRQYEDMCKEHQRLVNIQKESSHKFSDLATELSDTKIKLMEFEASFHQRVLQVDEKYASKIHSLMTENSELRRSYMRKCAELYDAKVKFEKTLSEKDEELKKAVEREADVRAACQADVRAARQVDQQLNDDQMVRPLSAPITEQEVRLVSSMVSDTALVPFVEEGHPID